MEILYIEISGGSVNLSHNGNPEFEDIYDEIYELSADVKKSREPFNVPETFKMEGLKIVQRQTDFLDDNI